MEKYCKIENSYREKYIQGMVEFEPEIENAAYITQEKIDGTNIRVHITSEGYVLGSQNTIIESGGKDHMGLKQLLKDDPRYVEVFTKISISIAPTQTLTLYGELFGHGILKRIPYGEKLEHGKSLRFFDLAINGALTSPSFFFSFMSLFCAIDLVIPVRERFDNLQDALDSTQVFKSAFADANAEGVVIKPYLKIYKDKYDQIFYLKHKNPRFKDAKPTKQINLKREYNPFLELITENRVLDLFSKEGTIQSKKEIGKYIKLLISDAIEDWLKDHEERPTKTQIGEVGRNVALILMKHIP